MAIKSGDLIQVGNQILVDRAQTAGPGTLNIPTETIYELGNYKSVAVVRGIPDLTYSLESFDASAELEAMLTGQATSNIGDETGVATDYSSLADGTMFDMGAVLPLDVVSEFKRGRAATNPFDVQASVAIPYLNMESISYRFGLTDNASQTISLRGDSIFYAGASAYVEIAVGTGTAGQTVALSHAAIPYNGDSINGIKYALGVSLKSGKRLFLGSDYTEAATGTAADGSRTVTLTITAAVSVSDSIRVIYQSPVVATYPQPSHAVASAIRPAAIKGKDIEIRVGGVAITDRWSGVQSVTVEERLTLVQDLEFGNAQAVSQDFDIPAVTGTVDIKPRDPAELLGRMRQAAGIASATEAIGPNTAVPVKLEILLHSPDTGAVLKTLYVPDAVMTMPAFSAQVNNKLTVSFPFTSNSGVLHVYKGARPANATD
jgi:predicted RecA/RadA family phage recombinase